MEEIFKQLYQFGRFRLDPAERLLLLEGKAVALTPKAFDVLLALVQQPGHLLEKEVLLKAVWPDSFVEESNLADNVSRLRKALGEGESGQKFIETIPKRGYRFVAEVTKQSGPAMKPMVEESVAPASAGGMQPTTPPASVPASRGNRSRIILSVLAFLVPLLVGVGLWLSSDGWIGRKKTQAPVAASDPKVVPFTSFPGDESEPAFSPEGDRIVFVWRPKDGNADIYVKQLGGGRVAAADRRSRRRHRSSLVVRWPSYRLSATIRSEHSDLFGATPGRRRAQTG